MNQEAEAKIANIFRGDRTSIRILAQELPVPKEFIPVHFLLYPQQLVQIERGRCGHRVGCTEECRPNDNFGVKLRDTTDQGASTINRKYQYPETTARKRYRDEIPALSNEYCPGSVLMLEQFHEILRDKAEFELFRIFSDRAAPIVEAIWSNNAVS